MPSTPRRSPSRSRSPADQPSPDRSRAVRHPGPPRGITRRQERAGRAEGPRRPSQRPDASASYPSASAARNARARPAAPRVSASPRGPRVPAATAPGHLLLVLRLTAGPDTPGVDAGRLVACVAQHGVARHRAVEILVDGAVRGDRPAVVCGPAPVAVICDGTNPEPAAGGHDHLAPEPGGSTTATLRQGSDPLGAARVCVALQARPRTGRIRSG